MSKAKFNNIIQEMQKKERCMVMFSGGLDSSVLAWLAHQAIGDNSLAITIDSPIILTRDRDDARERAEQIGIKQKIIFLNELENNLVSMNGAYRCYHCRKIRNQAVLDMAEKLDFPVVAEGMNSSDLLDYRPGLRASEEDKIWKPFIEQNISKEEIRKYARINGLDFWDIPSTVCLCTRIPYNRELDIEELKMIEEAEYVLRDIGFFPVRVRSPKKGVGIIEVTEPDQVIPHINSIVCKLKKLGFSVISLDLEGFISGKLNRDIHNDVV